MLGTVRSVRLAWITPDRSVGYHGRSARSMCGLALGLPWGDLETLLLSPCVLSPIRVVWTSLFGAPTMT
ncbi:hypothetical protein NL676_025316 [Syzygium grande]|nr:hypothetical protein NL676_025316 [Syzygium grande]